MLPFGRRWPPSRTPFPQRILISPSTDLLAAALARASSRIDPPPTPARSVLIHGAVLFAWLALFALAFRQGGVLAWSVGIAYIAYDTLLQAFVGWHTWRLLRPADTAPPASACSIAVVVAAHNEATVLPATLAALLGQNDAPDEIVIADDGSTDATAELLTGRYGLVAATIGATATQPSLAKPGTAERTSPERPDAAVRATGVPPPSLRWLRLPHGGKARALNAAIVEVTSDIVLTVDGDTLLETGAIAAVRRAFAAEPALAGITGVITPVCKPTLAGRCLEWFQTYEYIRNFLSRYAWMQVGGLLLISGAFAGFRRDSDIAVGGFDAACLVEDYELIHRMRRHAARHGLDWRFRVLGGAQARTEAPGSVGAFLRQRRRWFGGFLQTQYWYRAMVGDARLGLLGTLMLPVKAIDTLQPLYGLTAFALLVAYAALGRLKIIEPVALVIGTKIVIDLAFHLWSVHLYRRWLGDGTRASFGFALLAALAEPFTFQLLRHTGALLGWVSFVTGQRQWGRQTRFGLDQNRLD